MQWIPNNIFQSRRDFIVLRHRKGWIENFQTGFSIERVSDTRVLLSPQTEFKNIQVPTETISSIYFYRLCFHLIRFLTVYSVTDEIFIIILIVNRRYFIEITVKEQQSNQNCQNCQNCQKKKSLVQTWLKRI